MWPRTSSATSTPSAAAALAHLLRRLQPSGRRRGSRALARRRDAAWRRARSRPRRSARPGRSSSFIASMVSTAGGLRNSLRGNGAGRVGWARHCVMERTRFAHELRGWRHAATGQPARAGAARRDHAAPRELHRGRTLAARAARWSSASPSRSRCRCASATPCCWPPGTRRRIRRRASAILGWRRSAPRSSACSTGHMPYPAVIVDRRGDLVVGECRVRHRDRWRRAALLAPPVNVARCCCIRAAWRRGSSTSTSGPGTSSTACATSALRNPDERLERAGRRAGRRWSAIARARHAQATSASRSRSGCARGERELQPPHHPRALRHRARRHRRRAAARGVPARRREHRAILTART